MSSILPPSSDSSHPSGRNKGKAITRAHDLVLPSSVLQNLYFYIQPDIVNWYDDPTAETYSRVNELTDELMHAIQEELPLNRKMNARLEKKLKSVIFNLLHT